MTDVNRRVLPGFSLSLGYTMLYMSLLILVPLGAGFLKASHLSFAEFWAAVSSQRAVAAYTLTVGASFVSAVLNALVDLPFALPTAVAGLVYSDLFVARGWYGRFLVPLGIEGAYSRLGIVLVLVFIGFPFVVRTLQPVLEGLDADVEEAAACLGANRRQTFVRVIVPAIVPALITGFALAFARSLGEYGSVVFISGNKPYHTEIAPVLVVNRLEEFAYTEATAIAVVILMISFVTLFAINLLERWSKRHG